MIHIYFNPLSNNRHGTEAVEEVKAYFPGKEIQVEDITKIPNAAAVTLNLEKDDIVVICGGDGTIHRFVNQAYRVRIPQEIFYYRSGSGNDFAHDINDSEDLNTTLVKLIPLKKYYESLPIVTVNGKSRYFINGVGFGLDGYCCEAGDRLRAESVEKINYSSIAVKGLMGDYKPCSATVTVDGVSKTYRNVWLAPTMIGRYYGGGMKVAPDQDRLNSEKTVTTVVWHGTGKLRTLMNFKKIFKGTHVKKHFIALRTGHEVTVEFSKPQPLQIDGETICNVTKYSVVYK
jgi:diacylglycerol kinase (ATP)